MSVDSQIRNGVAKLSCRFRTSNGLCTFHESSIGECKFGFCPLVEKFGGISDG